MGLKKFVFSNLHRKVKTFVGSEVNPSLRRRCYQYVWRCNLQTRTPLDMLKRLATLVKDSDDDNWCRKSIKTPGASRARDLVVTHGSVEFIHWPSWLLQLSTEWIWTAEDYFGSLHHWQDVCRRRGDSKKLFPCSSFRRTAGHLEFDPKTLPWKLSLQLHQLHQPKVISVRPWHGQHSWKPVARNPEGRKLPWDPPAVSEPLSHCCSFCWVLVTVTACHQKSPNAPWMNCWSFNLWRSGEVHACGVGQSWDWYLVPGQQDSTKLAKLKSHRWQAPRKFVPFGKRIWTWI